VQAVGRHNEGRHVNVRGGRSFSLGPPLSCPQSARHPASTNNFLKMPNNTQVRDVFYYVRGDGTTIATTQQRGKFSL